MAAFLGQGTPDVLGNISCSGEESLLRELRCRAIQPPALLDPHLEGTVHHDLGDIGIVEERRNRMEKGPHGLGEERHGMVVSYLGASEQEGRQSADGQKSPNSGPRAGETSVDGSSNRQVPVPRVR